MSQVFAVVGGVIAAVVTMVVLGGFYPGLVWWIEYPLLGALFVAGTVLWWYSPLPNHNDPLMGDPGMYWGFSKDE